MYSDSSKSFVFIDVIFYLLLDRVERAKEEEKHKKKSNRFGGLKAPKNPISVGEEYIVSIEEIGN